jgi:hypothetical protein
VFDRNVMDPQIGGMALLLALMKLDTDATFTKAARAAAELAEQPLSTSKINRSAAVGGGLTIAGVASEAYDRVTANDTLLQAFLDLTHKPGFWFAVAALAAFGAVTYYRRRLRDEVRGV